MTAPGDVVGQAVVNVRTCLVCGGSGKGTLDGKPQDWLVCGECNGKGTWVDTSNPTMVERMDADGAPDPDGYYFRPVENGDTDE